MFCKQNFAEEMELFRLPIDPEYCYFSWRLLCHDFKAVPAAMLFMYFISIWIKATHLTQ